MEDIISREEFITTFLLSKKISFWYDVDEIIIEGDVKIKSHLKELIERGAILSDGRFKFILKKEENGKS